MPGLNCYPCYFQLLTLLQTGALRDFPIQTKTAVYLFLERFFISFWSDIFTFIYRKMHTFDFIIVKGDTLRLLIVKCVTHD